MLYYNTLAAYLKTSKFQLVTKRYFPVIVMLLLLLETFMVLSPTLGIRSSIAEQHCVYGDTSVEARSRLGWLYNVLFPYFLPFVAAVGPFIFLSIRLKEGHIIEPHKSQVLVSLAVVGGYFVFYLLYYILMVARQVEFLVDTSSSMQRLIGEDDNSFCPQISTLYCRCECDVHHEAHVCSDWSHLAHLRAPVSPAPGQGAPQAVASQCDVEREVSGPGGQ